MTPTTSRTTISAAEGARSASHPLSAAFLSPLAVPAPTRWWERMPAIALGAACVLLAFVFFPPVRGDTRLTWTFAGVAGFLFVWSAVLWWIARRRGMALRVEFTPVRSHYVQAFVQACIMAYWGWYAKEVYPEAAFILAQLVFLYAFEALVTWSRGRTWRMGFGPMPIVLSTNLLLWFKHDWYVFQFLMIAAGALGKQFVTWSRDGRRTHIFNPSAFGQVLFAIVLIATGTTNELTWGERIAATFDTPHMLVVIFLGGLVVQYLFHVTLMTLAAAAVLAGLNALHTEVTGVYYFINTNIAATIFLGLHLLVTDPATSPRTNLGRVVFGGLYGLAYFVMFRVLLDFGVPLFWDKLLPVPILNLLVPLLDRFARASVAGRLNRWWESALRPARMNIVHMACWAGLFATMAATGYVESRHPGNSIPFWQRAVAEGRPRADQGLFIVASVQAEAGSGDAANEVGLLWLEGKVPGRPADRARAAGWFAAACRLGSVNGAINVADLFFVGGGARSRDDLARALDMLEQNCGRHPDSNICFRVGYAYEVGSGRPKDPARAVEFYERCGRANLFGAKGLARIALTPGGPVYDLSGVAPLLARSAAAGDDESCWYLAYMHHAGHGVPRDEGRARNYLSAACRLGMAKACDALKQPTLPPFTRPVLLWPPWSSAFPMVERTR